VKLNAGLNVMNDCICCQDSLLRHIRYGSIYWFCPTCRQDMPNINIRPSFTPCFTQQARDFVYSVEPVAP